MTTTRGTPEPPALSVDEVARLAYELVVEHGGRMDKDELMAALELLQADYTEALIGVASWEGWREGLFLFDVIDGEIMLRTAP